MWIIEPPSSTIRRASAAYSSGVYGIAGHWSRLATAPEIEQVRITGSSRLMPARYLGRRTAGLLTITALKEETRPGLAMTIGARRAVGVTDAERRLKTVLRVVAGLLLALTVAAAIGTIADALRKPPWIGSAVAAGVLVTQVALYAAGEPRRRRGLVWVLVAPLALAAAAQAAYAIAGKPQTALLIALAAAEAAVALVVTLAARAAERHEAEPRGHWPSEASAGLVPVLLIAGGLFAAEAAGVLLVDQQPLLTAHAAAAAFGIALVCLYAGADLRERLPLVSIPAVALLAGALAQLAIALPLATNDRGLLLASAGEALAVGALLLLLRRAAARARLHPEFLGATEYRTLMALAD